MLDFIRSVKNNQIESGLENSGVDSKEEMARSECLPNDMHIEILGTESLGVRGLSCLVEVQDRKIVIDPGLALGYKRHGLLPHPAQVAMGETIRRKIITAWGEATDIVMSHFHGDHVPLTDANPYQLSVYSVASPCQTIRFWTKGEDGLSKRMLQRRRELCKVLAKDLPNTEEQTDGLLSFSPAVSHGSQNSRLGKVMMTRIQGAETVFVHASDIQLLDDHPISQILDWKPDIVLVAGPPIYLSQFSPQKREKAWRNAIQLAYQVETLIIDHHLLRAEQGLSWLDRLALQTDHRVLCAADFMQRPRCLLEAQRVHMYEEMPVPDHWHRDYSRGASNTQDYQHVRRECDQEVNQISYPSGTGWVQKSR
jgi:predicted metallo-beta-lactamase superfamily hydrolase